MEEKMDVAKAQSQILEAVSRIPNRDADTISRLNCHLLDMTQLYEQFAEPLGLWECKLAILHCANHYDAALVTDIWQKVINVEVKRLGNADAGTKLATLGRTCAQSEQFFPWNSSSRRWKRFRSAGTELQVNDVWKFEY
jgi:nuclear pore complex protein Nup155